jgi:hypothetical protein
MAASQEGLSSMELVTHVQIRNIGSHDSHVSGGCPEVRYIEFGAERFMSEVYHIAVYYL